MPRRKSMSSIETEISALKEKIAAAKKRYENLCLELEKRQEERDLILAQEVVQRQLPLDFYSGGADSHRI